MENIYNTVKQINTKYIQDNKCKILSEWSGFVYDVTKTFGVFFGFAVPIAVHLGLQNANDKFHKVVSRRYSGEVDNV